ncbi:site-specific integrase [Variovorax sp. Sphag1AA]|uniref:tyrosine-type recombinase/integrase n=1 Tax=Variovorax sp. Sphag1AA TaxID=2587027 RepID=UPI00160E42E2|nr:site-specific integrase [Variovorax sp. Sphag1AA]MBB3182269.1 integrase [Variovorax sp. Sphag1AA]
MAKAYKEGAGWAFRLRVHGQDIYQSGFRSKKAAEEARDSRKVELKQADKQVGFGAARTSVAQALCDYALAELPKHKGAEQEARRINRYLRAVQLPLLKVEKLQGEPGSVKASMRGQKRTEQAVHFKVGLEDVEQERVIPASLREHRARLEAEGLGSDTLRSLLARIMVADVSAHRLQRFVDALEKEGFGMSTVRLEVAVLRQMFNHSRKIWKWTQPHQNPASGLKIASEDNTRKRILSEEEWVRIAPVLARSKNRCVFPLVCLMIETAMRSSEPLTRLRWQDIDWQARVLVLPDSKTGKREVPLSPGAVDILHAVQAMELTSGLEEPVFPTTYETLKKAWKTACTAAGVSNLHLHDLRHTAATRYAIEFQGNAFFIKAVTGHKTSAMLDRYIHVNARHAAAYMHGDGLEANETPAGLNADLMAEVSIQAQAMAAEAKQAIRERVAREQSLRRQAQEARKAGLPWPPAPPLGEVGLGKGVGPDVPSPLAASANVIRVEFRKAA